MELDLAEDGWHLSSNPTVTQFFFNSVPMEILSAHLCSKILFLPIRNNKRNINKT
jgi:hypothetical protein